MGESPTLDDAMGLCIECWQALESCRPLGFGDVGPIPYTAILAWAEFQQLDRELTTMLIDVIHHLDVKRSERIASERALDDAKRRKGGKRKRG